MEYQVEYSYCYQDFLELNRVQRKTRYKWLNLIVSIVFIAIGVAGIVAMVLCLLGGEFLPAFIPGLAFSLLLTLSVLLQDHLNARISQKLSVGAKLPQSIGFGPDKIAERSGDIESAYPYQTLTALYKRRGRYFLYIDKRHALIVPCDKFTKGDSESFGACITEKTGKPVKELR